MNLLYLACMHSRKRFPEKSQKRVRQLLGVIKGRRCVQRVLELVSVGLGHIRAVTRLGLRRDAYCFLKLTLPS